MRKIAIGTLLVAFLAACSSNPIKDATPTKVEDKSSAPAAKGPETKPATQAQVAVNPLKDPNNILSKRNVYFDFDEYVVRDEFKSLVQAHARYLTQTASAKVTVQGNCDERGSREYNIALGQKRADGVKKMLLLMGAQESQVESVSLGEEKPRCTETTEACYGQNRRSDMLYGGEY